MQILCKRCFTFLLSMLLCSIGRRPTYLGEGLTYYLLTIVNYCDHRIKVLTYLFARRSNCENIYFPGEPRHGNWNTNSDQREAERFEQHFLQNCICCAAAPFEHSRDWSWKNTPAISATSKPFANGCLWWVACTLVFVNGWINIILNIELWDYRCNRLEIYMSADANI